MRIRKGHRCLPLHPVDRGYLHDGEIPRVKDAQVVEDAKEDVNRALEDAAQVAATSGRQYLEHGNSTLGAKYLEGSLETSRVSAAELLVKRSVIQKTGAYTTRTKEPIALASAESITTRNTPIVGGGTHCSASTAMEIADQPTLLVQSLRYVCAKAADTGLSAREAVVRIIEEGLPGLQESGERLIVQVAKSFRNFTDFVEREERGRYFLGDAPNDEDNSSLIAGHSHGTREKLVSTCAMIEAARQLQNMQRSRSRSRPGSLKKDKVQPLSDGVEAVLRDKVGLRQEPKSAADHRAVVKEDRGRSHSVGHKDQPAKRQCNRDDGKGWRCFRPAEAGFSLCRYHRDQIRKAEMRRKRAKAKSYKRFAAIAETYASARETISCDIPKVARKASAFAISDEEVTDQKRRRFVKAKSLRSLL